VDVVQLRDKHLEARAVVERSRLAARVCRDHGVPFILNDRPDLALDAEADGVHVGQDDVSPRLARRILGPDVLVGLSTHSSGDLESSQEEPVDYLSAGPVVATPTKPGRPGTGVGYVRTATTWATKPVFVTGGVTPETIPTLAEAGATRFVVVRYLTESDDPRGAAARLRQAVDAVTDRTGADHAGADNAGADHAVTGDVETEGTEGAVMEAPVPRTTT
jgi:thiamine-phosphate pyrophosphorylase